jgi:N-acetylneuraminate lyase
VRINQTLDDMIAEEVFGAAKYLVGKYAVACGACRRPMPGLGAESFRRLDAVWERLLESIAITAREDGAAA